jgi:hypothetical protein
MELPLTARNEIAEVLEYIDANPRGLWANMPPELEATYKRWRDIIRQKDKPLLDNTGTIQTLPGLSSFGRLFLIEHRRGERAGTGRDQGGAGTGEGAGADNDPAEGKQAEGRGSKIKARRPGPKPLKEKNPVKFQVYERIQREHQAGEQFHATIERLKHDRQFLEQVQEVKLKPNPKLVRNALAYFDTQNRRNNQQIPPG